MITRIAPTPSGFLHKGNILNFLLINLFRKHFKGKLILRIDDFDGRRFRPEYANDIFQVLDKLGIEWDEGPKNIEDLLNNFSQQKMYPTYFDFLQSRFPKQLLYVCSCSRSDWANATHLCSCKSQSFTYAPEQTAIKLELTNDPVGLVLWRRENMPSYHLVSLFHDLRDKITHVVRGEDLKESTAIQKQLADIIGEAGFQKIHFFHHPLLLDANGDKLSKSVQTSLGTGEREDWDFKEVNEHAQQLFEKLI